MQYQITYRKQATWIKIGFDRLAIRHQLIESKNDLSRVIFSLELEQFNPGYKLDLRNIISPMLCRIEPKKRKLIVWAEYFEGHFVKLDALAIYNNTVTELNRQLQNLLNVRPIEIPLLCINEFRGDN